ncbi:MAG: MGMT family protein [Candidatus Peregrinibacteria bacterium]
MKQDPLFKLQQLLLCIPRGKVTTYQALAQAMGTRGYRFIGQLLHRNPEPDKYPCYKVVKSDGSLGGFARGAEEKVRRLKADGITVRDGKIVDFEQKICSIS